MIPTFCKICGSKEIQIVGGFERNLRIWECQDCETQFTTQKIVRHPAVRELDIESLGFDADEPGE